MNPNNPLDPTEESGLPQPPAGDPGGARAKGYSADPDSDSPEVPDPIPLVDVKKGGIHVPERDAGVKATGRSEPDPNDPEGLILGEGG